MLLCMKAIVVDRFSISRAWVEGAMLGPLAAFGPTSLSFPPQRVFIRAVAPKYSRRSAAMDVRSEPADDIGLDCDPVFGPPVAIALLAGPEVVAKRALWGRSAEELDLSD